MEDGSKAKEVEAMAQTQDKMEVNEEQNAAPTPISSKDVQEHHAPPSYEQVFGENQTNIVVAQPELPPLAYIDIMPRVLDPGNIRYKKAPTFDTFTGIVNGANVWLHHHPHLMCWKCETVERRVGVGNKIDLDSMSHHESGQGFNVHVLGLRIWFVKKMDGSPTQQLGLLNIIPEGNLSACVNKLSYDLKTRPLPDMHEIHPMQIRRSGSKSSSKFETSDGVIAQAQQWLQAQSGIRVVNIETRDVQAQDKNMKITIFSDKMDDFMSDSKCMYVRILRIFYVNTPEVTSYATTVLTSRLFTPLKLGNFEGMGQLMGRIVNWLQMTQLPIFSVETVLFPFVANPMGCRPERVDYGLSEGRGQRWLTAIRLYFPVPFQDPTPVHTQQSSGSCVLL